MGWFESIALASLALACTASGWLLGARWGTSAPLLSERLEVLERALPEWRLAMASLVDQADEILGTAERKRARAAADVSRTRKRDEGEEQPTLEASGDRAAVKRAVLRRLHQQGVRVGQ